MLSFHQQKLLSYFESAIKTDSVRHAYILKGDQGVGKKHLSHLIELYFACKDSAACGQCAGCKSAMANANFDIIRLSTGEKKKYDVATVRSIIKKVYEKPAGGKYKLVVIEDADALEPVCQNALLKVIEEPPSYVVFLVLCHSISGILPTIMSRVMVLELLPWSQDELGSLFSLDESNRFLFNFSMGSPGKLKKLLDDEGFKEARSIAIESISKLADSSSLNIFNSTEAFVSQKEHMDIMLESASSLLRDVMFFKNGLPDQIVNTDKMQNIKKLSDCITMSKCMQMTDLCTKMPSELKNNENTAMQIQAMFMKLEALLGQ